MNRNKRSVTLDPASPGGREVVARHPDPGFGRLAGSFGRYIAGPYCAGLLAEYGADVIRIEKRSGSEDRFPAQGLGEAIGHGASLGL